MSDDNSRAAPNDTRARRIVRRMGAFYLYPLHSTRRQFQESVERTKARLEALKALPIKTETFAEAVARQGLSPEDLALLIRRHQTNKIVFLIAAIVAGLTGFYALFGYPEPALGQFLLALTMGAIAVVRWLQSAMRADQLADQELYSFRTWFSRQ